MISVRSTFIIAIVGSFISGSFVASPELRAYAANTIGSADIIDGQVKNADLAPNAVTTSKINDGAVKEADVDVDAVGASEIQGVTKLKFDDCLLATNGVPPGFTFDTNCAFAGAAVGDNVIATRSSASINPLTCYDVANAMVTTPDLVKIKMRNNCASSAPVEAGIEISIIVFQEG